MTDEILRKALIEAPRGEHLAEEAWEALACGELEPVARAAAIEHITSCAECDRIYRALIELHAGAREFDPAVPTDGPATTRAPQRRPRRHSYGWLGLAAAAVLVLVVALPRSLEEPPIPTLEAPTDRDLAVRSASETDGGAEPVALDPVGPQARPPETIRWTPVHGAESYQVEIGLASGGVVWTSEPTIATEIPWPSLDPALTELRWRVRARLEGGMREVGSAPAVVDLSAIERPGS